MIWERNWDKPIRYREYKVRLSIFLDIAPENDEKFDTLESL